MDRPDLEQRAPLSGEDLMSTGDVVALTGLTRQAVDAAVRTGRMAGFRDEGPPPRIWVHRSSAEAYVRPGHDLIRTVQALAATVEDLKVQIVGLKAGRAGETLLRVENVSVKAVNVELLAAAAEQREVERLLQEAAELERAARSKADEAMSRSREVQRHYADALSQTQLPGNPEF